MFTMFEDSTICLLYLLNTSFQKVQVFKPSTSKSGNSEVYVVCLLFKGREFLAPFWDSLTWQYKNPTSTSNFCMFSLNDMNENFIMQIHRCCEFFMQKQIYTITENIKHFNGSNNKQQHKSKRKLHQLKTSVARYFVHKYNIVSICEQYKIVDKNYLKYSPQLQERWIFRDSTTTLDVENIFKCYDSVSDSVLTITIGKCIGNVLYSKFCATKHVSCLKNQSFSSTSSLYCTVLDSLYKTNSVISISQFSNQYDNTFQREFFKALKNKLLKCRTNLIFVKVPFVTSFCVGLLYISMLAFKYVSFSKYGFIVLHKPIKQKMIYVQRYFNVIDAVHHSLNSSFFQFLPSITHLLSSSALQNSAFFNAVWYYNNSLCNCVQ